MRILDLRAAATHDVTRYGSAGFRVGSLGRGLHVTAATLAAGGSIGEHEAPTPQLLIAVAGAVTVSGTGGGAELAEGQAVLWERGESHATSAVTAAVVIIVEGADLAALGDAPTAS